MTHKERVEATIESINLTRAIHVDEAVRKAFSEITGNV